ncbi:hypothetical protein Plhal304r1_c070g0158891 [Plasmopara halstedii]
MNHNIVYIIHITQMSCFSRGLIEPPSSFGHVNRNIIVVILHKALTKARLAFGTSVNILIQSKQPHEDTTRIYDDILLSTRSFGALQASRDPPLQSRQ